MPAAWPMSAVTVANRPYTIFFGVFFGMTGAAGLLISQYYGARDFKTCRALFALQVVIGLAASLCVGLWLALWPESVMRIFVSDPRTISLGMEYLGVIWLSYLPLAVSNVCIFSLRSIGENRMSMLVSLAAMGVNALCNYALIFGHFGLPAMGVAGAALGTLIARTVEMLFYPAHAPGRAFAVHAGPSRRLPPAARGGARLRAQGRAPDPQRDPLERGHERLLLELCTPG